MLWHDFLDVREIGACKIDIECADIFLQIFAALRPGNWNNIFALSEYPGERELRRVHFFSRAISPTRATRRPARSVQVFAVSSSFRVAAEFQ